MVTSSFHAEKGKSFTSLYYSPASEWGQSMHSAAMQRGDVHSASELKSQSSGVNENVFPLEIDSLSFILESSSRFLSIDQKYHAP